jgi:hypothetical protein
LRHGGGLKLFLRCQGGAHLAEGDAARCKRKHGVDEFNVLVRV